MSEEVMKAIVRAIRVMLVATAGLVAVGVAAASADDLVDAKVPFPFIVGQMRLPAGQYTVKEMTDGAGVVALVSRDGRQFVCTTTIPAGEADSASHPELVFKTFDGEMFLARIVPAGGTEREVILTPAEMARSVASLGAGQPGVTASSEVR
jgi:hypothetical protein